MQESISILKGGHVLQEGLARELEMVKKSIYGETSRLMDPSRGISCYNGVP